MDIKDADQFEKDNTIIYLKNVKDASVYFKSIQKEFFTNAIKTTQKNAVRNCYY